MDDSLHFNRCRSSKIHCLVICGALFGLARLACAADAQKPTGTNDKTAPIRASADAFSQAFNAGDAKAVAALWTPDGTETDEQGQVFKGRKAIEEQYAALFKARPDARIQVEVHSIDMPAPNVAVEDGVAKMITKSDPPSATRYTAVHIMDGGKWLMASVHEAPVDLKAGSANLQALEWLIGRWRAKNEDTVAESDIHWLANKTFIERDYTVRKNGEVTNSGKQLIGWDPQEGQIRSWSFDSSGGYGTGLWAQSADGWQIDHIGTLPDSTPTSAQDFVIHVSGQDNVLGWRSTHRMAGESMLPDTAEVVFDRVKEKP
ncbi:MAG TPA: SgcJ/EcaC family oxidoreductase [Lacipirellulaceae bacterium]